MGGREIDSGRQRDGPPERIVRRAMGQAGTPAHAALEAPQAESRPFASLSSAGEFLARSPTLSLSPLCRCAIPRRAGFFLILPPPNRSTCRGFARLTASQASVNACLREGCGVQLDPMTT